MLSAFTVCVNAQTASSLFWRSDSLYVTEAVSKGGNEYRTIGHHGPAVENSHSAYRIYFNDSGAIDVYSKTGRGMELLKYRWYPSEQEQSDDGAGCDEYLVGKTVGLGGIALWDGSREVKLVATGGRTARVGDTKKGSFAEMIAYGVEYKGQKVDISIRIDVNAKKRVAVVTATELSGRKVQFLTGVNYHKGESLDHTDKHLSVWGVHPADVSQNPVQIGAALYYNKKVFPEFTQTEDMLRIISKPSSKVTTKILSASAKEVELGSQKRFCEFVGK